ncbi:dysferlin-like isoform X4 [Symsagittifera roscoffensis]|uniref:dysferlin-like isoform X4 n=1 Tax=Symsagittifera roscoffensis TaxID=84072 RepID=UPI00307C342B
MADLKLTIQVAKATNLPNVEKKRDSSDPYVKLTFKSGRSTSKSVKSEHIDSNNNPEWNESHEIELGAALLAGDVLEAVIKDYERLGSDRTMAQCKISLKDCLSNPNVEIKQALMDASNKKLDNSFLFLNLAYSGAKKKSGGGGGGGASAGGAAGADGGEGQADAEAAEEAGVAGDFEEPVAVVDAASGDAGAMPDEGPPRTVKTKESLRGTLPKKAIDYQVRIKIWEARQLKGGGLKPVVKMKIGSQTKSSKVKSSDSPFWGEIFFFNFNMIPVELFDEVIEFQVCTSQRLRSDALIGSFKIDVGTVWDEDRHSVQSKWLMLTDPNSDSGELMGYLKVSAMVLGAGDEAPPDNQLEEGDDDVESNLLRPAGVQLRPATFWIRLFHGEDVPQMDTGSFTAIKSFFSGGDKEEDMKKQVDPFIIAKFAGKRVKSSVKYTSNEPIFNEQLQLKFNFPSMCKKLKLDLRDWDQMSGDDPIAMCEVLLDAISVTGEQGFLPTFGPCWLNFYGAPREEGKEATGGENESLNVGKGEGCAYRGRFMLEMGAILDKKPEAAVMPIPEESILALGKFLKTRKWRLFAMFEEANLIMNDLDEAIHFEVSVGNFGNSMDPDSSPMPSTTSSCQSVFDGQFYSYVPFGENKPIVSVDCDFEDISFRLAILNMLEKTRDTVGEQLTTLRRTHEEHQLMNEEDHQTHLHEVALVAIRVLDHLKNNLPRVIATIESMSAQGNTLDKNLNKFRVSQLTSMVARAQHEYESATEVTAVVDLLQEFMDMMNRLCLETQISIPDIIVWLMEDTKRIAYIRIPVQEVYYNKAEEFVGRYCMLPQNLILKYPGKKQQKECRAPCQLRLKLWFGLQVDEGAFSKSATEATLTTVAETHEYENYRLMWKKDSPNFGSKDGRIEMPKDKFQPPDGWEFDGDWFISRDKSCEVDEDEGLDYYVEDVFESQGRYPGLSWQNTPDKIKWVTMQSQESTPRDEIIPPPGWAWEDENDGWEVDMDRAVDEEGFEYCVDIDLGGWQASEKPFHVWRRRRWARPRVKLPEGEIAELRAAPGVKEEDEGWEYGKTYGSKFHKVEQKMDLKRRRRWQRKLRRVNPKAPPLFFFEFKKKDEIIKVAPRTFASFPQAHKYEMRAYIYQARDLLSSDDDGYSDPFCRVVIGNRSQKTTTQKLTVNPTWNQTLLFKNLEFYDSPEHLAEHPPPVVVEIFDWDSIGSDDFLGRVTITPTVKIQPTQGKKAELDWHPVTSFGESAGEILCAFELLLADPGVDLPFEPTRSDTDKKNFIVPQGIAPVQQRTAIEVLCWGVRNLQLYQLMTVDKPEMEFEIGNFRKKSTGVINIKQCPNFKNPVLFYEMMLPLEEKYTPPMNIKVRDKRQFGRTPIVGNHRIKSLGSYRIKPLMLTRPSQDDDNDDIPFYVDEEEVTEADVILPPLKMGEKRSILRAPSETNLAVVAGAEKPAPPSRKTSKGSRSEGAGDSRGASKTGSTSDVRIAVEDGENNTQSLLGGFGQGMSNLTGTLTRGVGAYTNAAYDRSLSPALGCKLPKMDSSNLPSKNEKSKIDISPPVTNTSTDKREHSRESSRNVTPEKEGAGIKDKPPSASSPSVTFSNRAGKFLDNCNPFMGGGSRPELPQAKVMKDDTLDWWTKYYASHHSDPKMLEKAEDYLNAGGDTLQLLDCELDEVPGLDSLQDFLRTFTLDQGKKATDEDGDYMGEFKGALVVYPLPSDRSAPQPKRYFSQVPTGDPKEVVIRIYIIKATGLQPMDDNGKADPYIYIECGKQEVNDVENYSPNTLDPMFGRMFEMTVTLPVEKDLKVAIWDWDAIGANDLIGETVIDLEDRYLSKHRALCGIPKSYKIKGHNLWRDCQTPKEILEWYCLRNNITEPLWNSTTEVVVNRFRYTLATFEKQPPEPVDEYGPEDERLALHVLNQLDLVKEHVERRSLYAATQPNLDQGQLYMWVDMFPKELGAPAEPVDITPRKCQRYFLRVAVFNTFDTILDETTLVGDSMSDIYVKGWLEGAEHDRQKTDVHYRCMDGHGMFNWRFVFEFDYDPSERKIVVKRKEHFWSLDETETHYPARLNLQIWDNDLISADDFLGSIQLDLEKMIQPSKTRKGCTLQQLQFDPPEVEGGNRPVSLFLYRRLKGMWPMKRDLGDGEGPQLTGKLDMEIELCDESEHAERACGKARDEPNSNPTLEPPNRPATSFLWFMSPWATFKHIIWKHYKWHMIITLITIFVVLFLALFIYTLPGNMLNAIMNAII